MKTIDSYTLDEMKKPGYLTVISSAEHICEKCQIPLKCKDRKERRGWSYNGKKNSYLIRRMYCPDCHALHTELPSVLVKNRRYEFSVIEDVVNGVISEDDGLDYPSDSTMVRWRKFYSNL